MVYSIKDLRDYPFANVPLGITPKDYVQRLKHSGLNTMDSPVSNGLRILASHGYLRESDSMSVGNFLEAFSSLATEAFAVLYHSKHNKAYLVLEGDEIVLNKLTPDAGWACLNEQVCFHPSKLVHHSLWFQILRDTEQLYNQKVNTGVGMQRLQVLEETLQTLADKQQAMEERQDMAEDRQVALTKVVAARFAETDRLLLELSSGLPSFKALTDAPGGDDSGSSRRAIGDGGGGGETTKTELV